MNAQEIIIQQLNAMNNKISILMDRECATGADLSKEIRVIDKQIAALHKRMVKLMKVK
jgi:hypothetical protein